MKSKLQDHAELVATRLQQGLAYTEIVRELSELGCITTRQNLTSWLKRRAARIQSRSHLADPLSALQASAQVVPNSAVSAEKQDSTVASGASVQSVQQAARSMPVVTRSSSVVKSPPSSAEVEIEELAKRAAKPPSLNWKKKNV